MSYSIVWRFMRAYVAVVVPIGAALIFASSGVVQAKLIHVESASTTTSSGNVANGPVGPGCDAVLGGPACAFVDYTYEGNGQDSPGGPFTFAGSGGIFYGIGGSNITPSGMHDAIGDSIGACGPTFANTHATYSDGSTLDTTYRGVTCCVGSSCANAFQFGPVSAAHYYGTCISGTGRFAGVQCSTETTTSNSNLNVGEAVMLLPGK